VAKINSLPADAKTVLIIGSCLGAKFDALVVESLLTTIHPPDINEIMGGERLMNALELASKERIVNRQRGSAVYRFAHDKIHQAFYSLVSEIANADELHLRIGRALLAIWKARKQCQKPDQDWLTFLAANQLNLGAHLVPYSEESVEIAEVNLAAAKSAMNASAYRPTAEYLSRGLKIIEGWGWSHYDLRLELLTFQSRTEFCLGNFPECHKAVNGVLQNARTAKEKIPVFQVCVDDAYGAAGKVNVCIQEGLNFVKQLGVKLPKKFSKLTVIFNLIKAKQLMKGKTEEMLLTYPLANDPTKIAAMRIINTIVTFAVQARLHDLMATLAVQARLND